VGLTPQEADRLPGPAVFELTLSPGNRLDVKATVGETSYNKRFSKLPGLLVTPAGTFTFTLAGDSAGVSEPQTLTAVVSNPMQMAKRYAAALSVEPTSKTTSIVIVSLKKHQQASGRGLHQPADRSLQPEHQQRQKRSGGENGRVHRRTYPHHQRRIVQYREGAGNLQTGCRTDGPCQRRPTGCERKFRLREQRVENGTQLNLVRYLAEYISAPDKINAVLPVNVGLTDQSLSSLIGQYNEMVLQRNRLLRNSSESNPVIVNLDRMEFSSRFCNSIR